MRCAISDKSAALSGIVEREGDFTVPSQRKEDRRIRRTRDSLREALVALIREKPYDDIVVKEILARANVSRSTFYTHFRDKNELLLSGIHHVLRSAPRDGQRTRTEWSERILWFSLPIFEHIARHRQAAVATMDPEGRRALHEHLQQAIPPLIENEVGRSRRGSSDHTPLELLASWIAATFVLVLDWWVESDPLLPARDADRVFRALVRPALAEMRRPGAA
jgi:AcrR family transcriptional regulator